MLLYKYKVNTHSKHSVTRAIFLIFALTQLTQLDASQEISGEEYYIQIGIFEQPRNISNYARRLDELGYHFRAEPFVKSDDVFMVKILLGPYTVESLAREEAKEAVLLADDAFLVEQATKQKREIFLRPTIEQLTIAQQFLDKIEVDDPKAFEALFAYKSYFHFTCRRLPTFDDLATFLVSKTFTNLLTAVDLGEIGEKYYQAIRKTDCSHRENK